MKILWAPWRTTYINAHKKDENCFICDIIRSSEDEKNLVLLRKTLTIVIMNRYPYNNGHLMVCPIRHIKFPFEMNSEERQEVMEAISQMTQILNMVYKPQGFNIGANVGQAAGAGEEHLHFHILPRWNSDTNFMTPIAETRVIPELLEDTFKKIKKEILKQGNY